MESKYKRIVAVLPNYNSKKYLEQVIEAFLSQRGAPKLLVIVDGKSTDGSHEIIQKYADANSEIEWIKESDTGISSALNLASSRLDAGDIWSYLGADDILLPGVYEKTLELFNALSGECAIYYDSYTRDAGGGVSLRRCPLVTFDVSSLVRYGTIVGLQNIFFSASIIKNLGFNEGCRYAMDYELYLRVVQKNRACFMYYPLPSTINIADGNISVVHSRAANREAMRCARMHCGVSIRLIWRYVRHCVSAVI